MEPNGNFGAARHSFRPCAPASIRPKDSLFREAAVEPSVALDAVKGVIAAIAATIVLALLMMLNNNMGWVPGLDLVSHFMTLAGSTEPMTGWIVFAIVLALIGGLVFSLLDAHLDRPEGWEEILRGLLFGLGAFLLAGILIMPMSGGEAFGMKYGIGGPIYLAIAFLVYGGVMGFIYGMMRPEPATE